jgi:hypothetical protein
MLHRSIDATPVFRERRMIEQLQEFVAGRAAGLVGRLKDVRRT